jgi:hypothetical protein
MGVVDLVGGVMGAPRSDDGNVCIFTPAGHHLWRYSSARWMCGRLGDWASVFACFSRGYQGGAACHLLSTTTSLSCMVPRGINGQCVMMDTRREVALSGTAVALMAGTT